MLYVTIGSKEESASPAWLTANCMITPGNVKNRFDLELFGSSEINKIYTSLHEHSPILLSLWTFLHPTWPFSQRKLASRRTPCSEIQRVSLLAFGVVCIYFSLKMHLKGETNTTKTMKCICLQFGLKIKGRFIYLSWTTQTEDISSRISWQFMLPVTLCNIFMQDEILVALMNTYFSWGPM